MESEGAPRSEEADLLSERDLGKARNVLPSHEVYTQHDQDG